jgi:glycosyltransferase involved in cell wall biosynthesis
MAAVSPARAVAVLSSASGGGAGIAAHRLTQALAGRPGIAADFIDIAALGEALPQDAAPQQSFSARTLSDTHFTLEYPGFQRGWLLEMLAGYDLVNVHWASYLIGLAELHALARMGRPMLFWLHDFHYITGGCHYPAGCTGYLGDCRACPQLDTARARPVTVARNLAVKREIFAFPDVHLAAPSRFLRDRAVAAGIVPAARAHVLRNAYQPLLPPPGPRAPARQARTPRVLLIADSLDEGRKNMAGAIAALARAAAAERLVVDIVGRATDELRRELAAAGLAHLLHGRITDHAALSAILAEADLLFSASREDNWPNILVEAGSYGVMPVVGPGHGCAEFVRHYGFGQIAPDYAAESFAAALSAALAELRGPAAPAARARAAAQIRADHAPAEVAAAFAGLLDRLCPRMTPQPESEAAGG